jgi:beta-lactamase class D
MFTTFPNHVEPTMQNSRVRIMQALFLGVACTLQATANLLAVPPEEPAELAAAFSEAGVTGTFVMLNASDETIRAHDFERARKRFVPASTFKIPNTIIGLDCGAISSVDQILPYGGEPQPFPEWEQDMSLRDAFPISNVPIYQELARRIGYARMQAGVAKLEYGNQEMGQVVDRFWLDGPLEISAVEQIDFLRRLTGGELPVAAEMVEALRDIALVEKTDAYELYGKTGWAGNVEEPVGWFVGWVEKDGISYFFALNIDATSEEEIPKRVPLAKECLRLLGVL